MSAFLQCLCVRGGFDNWCAAVKAVVRPDEVRHLVQFSPRSSPPAPFENFVSVVAAFVGRYEYIPDPPDCDRWCSPGATMARGGGDCDDLSVLAVSLLLAGNVDAYLMVGRWAERDGEVNHAWVEGRDEFGPFHIEATSGTLVRGARPANYHAHYQLHPDRCFDIRPQPRVPKPFDWGMFALVAGAALVVGGLLVSSTQDGA